MKRSAISSLLAVLLLAGCATTGIKYEKAEGAPELPGRGAGCHVEIMELGRELEHEYEFKTMGTLVWKLSAAELRALDGEEAIQKRLLKAACEYGLYVVTDITAYPNSQYGGATYEAKGGVLLDKEGNPIGGVVEPERAAGAGDAGPAR